MLGFLAVNAILGGQTLSLASGSDMSYDVGIVVVGIISLIVRQTHHIYKPTIDDVDPPALIPRT
jgi:hypothetical protein